MSAEVQEIYHKHYEEISSTSNYYINPTMSGYSHFKRNLFRSIDSIDFKYIYIVYEKIVRINIMIMYSLYLTCDHVKINLNNQYNQILYRYKLTEIKFLFLQLLPTNLL